MEDVFERLVAAGIELIPAPDLGSFFLFTRDGFGALVSRTESGFGAIGDSGLLTECGFALLLRRGTGHAWVLKGQERAATADEVELLRAFSTDLRLALGK